MSIIIKGMEMPDSCFHCKLAEVCQHYKAEHYANKRHEDCPLEELPTQEERSNTLDALDKEKKSDETLLNTDRNTVSNGFISRQDAIEAIRSADGVVHYWSKQNAIKVLEELPPAQPTSTLLGYKVDHLNIIACEDCNYYILHDKRCGFWNHGVKTYDWCSRAERKSDE